MKFWAVLGSRGCKEKKLPTAISMQLFVSKKKIIKIIKNYFSIRTEKLHSIKTKKILKNFGRYFILG